MAKVPSALQSVWGWRQPALHSSNVERMCLSILSLFLCLPPSTLSPLPHITPYSVRPCLSILQPSRWIPPPPPSVSPFRCLTSTPGPSQSCLSSTHSYRPSWRAWACWRKRAPAEVSRQPSQGSAPPRPKRNEILYINIFLNLHSVQRHQKRHRWS